MGHILTFFRIHLVVSRYFEARLRPMKTQIVNAFWLSSDTPDEWTEIDVVETAYVSAEENKFGVDHRFRVNPNLHTFRSTARKQGLCDGCDGKVFSARPTTYTNKAPLADAFHTYGLAWTKEAITFYFDGEPYVQVDNDGRWDQALFLKFDVETNFAWQGVLVRLLFPARLCLFSATIFVLFLLIQFFFLVIVFYSFLA